MTFWKIMSSWPDTYYFKLKMERKFCTYDLEYLLS